MTDHKYTDEEVIRALEHYKGFRLYPFSNHEKRDDIILVDDALDLINRQRAEIERLKKLSDEGAECPTCHGVGKIGTTNWLTKDLSKKQIAKEKAESVAEFHRELKAEAIKEFAERLETALLAGGIYPVIVKRTIHRLAEEMIRGEINQ